MNECSTFYETRNKDLYPKSISRRAVAPSEFSKKRHSTVNLKQIHEGGNFPQMEREVTNTLRFIYFSPNLYDEPKRVPENTIDVAKKVSQRCLQRRCRKEGVPKKVSLYQKHIV